MSRMMDYKIVAEVLMFSLTVDECDCRGPLDTCLYCATVRGQEALERLVESDPFVEIAERAVGELSEPSVTE